MPETDDFKAMHISVVKLECLRKDLRAAFIWSATMDGFIFWSDVSIRLTEMLKAYEEWENSQP